MLRLLKIREVLGRKREIKIEKIENGISRVVRFV